MPISAQISHARTTLWLECVDYSEQYYEDEHYYSDSEYEANQKEILFEIYEDQESYARSEEEGWYHPDTEGSWEDYTSSDNSSCYRDVYDVSAYGTDIAVV